MFGFFTSSFLNKGWSTSSWPFIFLFMLKMPSQNLSENPQGVLMMTKSKLQLKNSKHSLVLFAQTKYNL